MKTGTINYAIYEDGNEYLGTAKVTLPDATRKTLAVNGAGVAGDLEIPIPINEAETLKIDFITVSENAHKLAEYRVHTLDLRVAAQDYDSTMSKIGVSSHKHIVKVIPKTLGGGDVAPASAQAVSGEYNCISREEYIDGKLVEKYDPLNFVNIDASGNDNLAAVRSALGK